MEYREMVTKAFSVILFLMCSFAIISVLMNVVLRPIRDFISKKIKDINSKNSNKDIDILSDYGMTFIDDK